LPNIQKFSNIPKIGNKALNGSAYPTAITLQIKLIMYAF
jgi:hypothetical protein